MQKSEKNRLIGAIQAVGLSPAQFAVVPRTEDDKIKFDEPYLSVELTGSPLAFRIADWGAAFDDFRYRMSLYARGYEMSEWWPVGYGSGYVIGLQDLLDVFTDWLETVVKPYLAELAEPDLWETYSADTRLMDAGSATDDNTLFNAAELPRINKSLNEVRAFLSETHPHSDEERQFVEERLKYLEDAATRLGRKDWINITAGVLSNIVVGLALSPDAARGLFQIAGQALSWLLDAVRLLP